MVVVVRHLYIMYNTGIFNAMAAFRFNMQLYFMQFNSLLKYDNG